MAQPPGLLPSGPNPASSPGNDTTNSRVNLPHSFTVVDTGRATGGFTIYKVAFKVKDQSPQGEPLYNEYELWKRFSDFQLLSKQLEAIHLHSKSQTKLPVLIKAKYFERFKESVIEERKSSAQALLKFVSSHDHLALSQPLQQFTTGAKMVRVLPHSKSLNNSPVHVTTPTTSYIDKPTDSIPLSRQLTELQDEDEEQLALGSSLTKNHLLETLSDRETDHTDGSREESISPAPPLAKQAVASSPNTVVGEAGSLEESRKQGDLGKTQFGSHVSLEDLELLASADTTVYDAEEMEQLGDGEMMASQHSDSKEATKNNSHKKTMTEASKDSDLPGLWRETDTSSESSSNAESPRDSTISIDGGSGVRENENDKEESKTSNEGMTWWADAMAESETVTDDLDALVEKLEEGPEISKPAQEIPNPPLDETDSIDKQNESRLVQLGVTSDQPDDGVSKLSVGVGAKSSVYPSNETTSSKSAGKKRSSSRSPSPGRRRTSPAGTKKADYIIQAGRLITQALNYEKNREYQEAFDLFKAGVDLLLNGVQTDRNKHRREIVSKKTSEYLQHAESLFQRHLASKERSTPEIEEQAVLDSLPAPPTARPHLLPDFKVIDVMGKMMLVESKFTGQRFMFKVLYKSLQAMSARKGASKTTVNRAPTTCPHMVKLLHHYETPNHRIFLLLEYARRGTLTNFVSSKRDQWSKLHEAALNPPPSSSLLKRSQGDGTPANEGLLPGTEDSTSTDDQLEADDNDDQDMERMLSELTSIVPPTSLPVTDSLTSTESGMEGDESETNDSLDSLAIMRRRLEETFSNKDDNLLVDEEQLLVENIPISTNGEDSQGPSENTISVSVQPPTPTVTSHTNLGLHEHNPALGVNTTTAVDLMKQEPSLVRESEDVLSSVLCSESVTVPGTTTKSKGSSGTSSPCFSPGSLRNSPEPSSKVKDDWVQRLEDSVREWAAQIVLALEHLHNHGIICRDLNISNILISDSGRALLTYFGKWDYVDYQMKYELGSQLYMAPELLGLGEPTPAADWWSLGAVLFEILTGKSLSSCHPGGVHSHLPLRIPVVLSPEAQSLLRQLLQVNPSERLGSGLAGVEELKSHPFFFGIDWRTV